MQFQPHLPADWTTVGVHGIHFLDGNVSFDIRRDLTRLELNIDNAASRSFQLDFAPAYPPCAQVTGATFDGRALTWKPERESVDWHPTFSLTVKPGRSTLTIRHTGFFGYAVPFTPPALAETSASLKIISERWTDNGRTLALTVSGRPARRYRLDLVNAGLLTAVEGAEHAGGVLVINMPPAASDDYVNHLITFHLASM
jgi:hypothetical protein